MKHHKSQSHEDTFAGAFGGTMNSAVTEALSKGASMYGRSFAAVQKEGLRFAQQRLEDNRKAVEAFGACKSLPDLFAVQQRWFAEMTRAYSEEWQRYGELMSEAMHEASDEARAALSEPLANVHHSHSKAAE
jgi:hypothetical protein